MTTLRGESGFWAAASSQRTLYRIRAEALRRWLFFQSGRQRYVGFINLQGNVEFFFDRLFRPSVKEFRLPLKAGAKIVYLIVGTMLSSVFFLLFFEEKG